MKAIGAETPFREKICELLNFFRDTYKKVFDFDHPPLHDPAAVFYVLHPEAFHTKMMRVDIERGSLLSRGQTVCDVYGRSTRPINARVALSVNVTLFWKHMIAAVHAVDN
jgi:inosine-uridine nucleoside N-ribohydrolase